MHHHTSLAAELVRLHRNDMERAAAEFRLAKSVREATTERPGGNAPTVRRPLRLLFALLARRGRLIVDEPEVPRPASAPSW
ncbi:hypothetical protein [Pseudonocardia sp. GCM10023141]|uniref:hypothetical protein n=1 Tax=Pseudonocardia sp. GCM10023141 TaxID=3252653 RepID=UPI00361A84B5